MSTPKRKDAMKVCGTCKAEKPLTDFNNQAKTNDGLMYHCRECQRIYKLMNRYGVTLDWYQKTLVLQNQACAVCGILAEEYAKTHKTHRFLVVDHNHETGKARGLLCNNCNIALGAIQDEIATAYSMARYLKKHMI